MSEHCARPRWRDRLIVGAGYALQGCLLSQWLGGGWIGVGLVAGLAAAARRAPSAAVSCCSLGGLGMLLGSWLDVRLGAGLSACHLSGTASTGVAPWASFMFWGMMLGCLPACRLGCALTRGALVLGHLGMVIGMYAGGRALGSPLAAWTGSAFAGAHLAMLGGMGLGTASGVWLATLGPLRAHLKRVSYSPVELDRASAQGSPRAVVGLPCTSHSASDVP